MASKESFSAKEWKLIKDAPDWVYAALAAGDVKVALTTKMKESKSFKKAVANYKTRSELIRDVIEDDDKPAKALKNATLSDAEEALEQISQILERKLTRQEADEFKDFLLAIGQSVAESAGEGMLGAGKKVSKKEASTLSKIEVALKATEADKKARAQAEAKAKREAEEARKKWEAEAKAKREAEEARKKREAEAKAKKEAEEARKKRETEAKAKKEAQEARKKREAEETAKRQAEAKAKREAERAAAATKAQYIAEHTVVSGDTLSHIALKYYGSAARSKWMAVYEENKEIIGDNPNLIRPGQVLKIPELS